MYPMLSVWMFHIQAYEEMTVFSLAVNASRMYRWSSCNALVFEPGLLDARLEKLLLARFQGTDVLCKVVDDALRAGVAAAPR